MRILATLLAAFVASVAIVGLVSEAVADDVAPAVVVLGADAAFDEALADTLVDNRVIPAGQLATPALGDLAVESRRIADERGAVVTVWLSRASSGATLVTYERITDRFLVRELPYAPPLTATQAAEAARMVRTMLRALRTADDESTAATSNASRAPVVRPAVPPPRFGAFFGIGAWFAAPAADATAHLGPTVIWRPHSLGLAASAALAPAQAFTRASFEGEVRDVAIALELRTSLRPTLQLRLAPSAGIALHVISVSGAFEAGDAIRARRYDPALRAGLVGTLALRPGLEAGIGMSVDCLLVRQAYEAAMAEILVVPRIQVMLAAIIGVTL